METAGERVRAEVEVKEHDDLILNFSFVKEDVNTGIDAFDKVESQ